MRSRCYRTRPIVVLAVVGSNPHRRCCQLQLGHVARMVAIVVRSAIGVASVSWYALTLVLVVHGQSVGPRWRLGRQRKSRSRSEEQPARSRSQSRPTQLVASRARLASGHLHHGRLLVLGLVRRQPSSSWTCELHLRSRVFRQHTIARTRERTSERTNERASERTVHLLHINRRKLASGCGVTREIEALSLWVRVSQPGDEVQVRTNQNPMR